MMEVTIRPVTMDDYDDMLYLWNSAEQSRRALNPVDDSREGIDRYLRRNPDTCFAAVTENRLIGVILSGHDGRRGIIHHLCVHPDFRRRGLSRELVRTLASQLNAQGREAYVFSASEANTRFYQNSGFAVCAEFAEYIKPFQ